MPATLPPIPAPSQRVGVLPQPPEPAPAPAVLAIEGVTVQLHPLEKKLAQGDAMGHRPGAWCHAGLADDLKARDLGHGLGVRHPLCLSFLFV